MELISELNPIIRGWAQYYNMENSSRYRSLVRNALYNLLWDWMREKHPTLGKKKLATMYFLTSNKDIDEIDADSPNPESKEVNTRLKTGNKVEYVKFKNTKWVFHGISRTESRFSKQSKTRVTYLLNPTESSPILTAVKYILPVKLREIHAFHPNIEEVKRFKLALALQSSSSLKTPSLKEKLFMSQKGLCSLCYRPIEEDYLLQNSVHILHIMGIKNGGEKFKLSNLALTHSWCHKEDKH